VLLVLAITATWPSGWWLDPVIGLGIAAIAVREGTAAWRGEECADRKRVLATTARDRVWPSSGSPASPAVSRVCVVGGA